MIKSSMLNKKNTSVMTILRWHINIMRSTTSKNVTILIGFYVNTECFSLTVCFKVTFETMTNILKLITYTYVIITYEVDFFFLCQNVDFIEILGISYHIFLSVIFS